MVALLFALCISDLGLVDKCLGWLHTKKMHFGCIFKACWRNTTAVSGKRAYPWHIKVIIHLQANGTSKFENDFIDILFEFQHI